MVGINAIDCPWSFQCSTYWRSSITLVAWYMARFSGEGVGLVRKLTAFDFLHIAADGALDA